MIGYLEKLYDGKYLNGSYYDMAEEIWDVYYEENKDYTFDRGVNYNENKEKYTYREIKNKLGLDAGHNDGLEDRIEVDNKEYCRGWLKALSENKNKDENDKCTQLINEIENIYDGSNLTNSFNIRAKEIKDNK